MRHIFRAARSAIAAVGIAAISGIVCSSGAANATTTLTYDSPVVYLAPGGSAEISATLKTDFGLVTDSAAFLPFGGQLSTGEELPSPIAAFPPDPLYLLSVLFAGHTSFTPTDPTPLANLNLPAGSSYHLALGILTADDTLPLGTYTTDVGIYQSCSFTCLILFGSPYEAPNFADAGELTVIVAVAAPEPALLILFSLGLMWLGCRRDWQVA